MSVPKHLRRKGKFEVITNAEALVKYTLEITSNEKNFPKRYRWCLTSKIVDTTVEMFSDSYRSTLSFNQCAYYLVALIEKFGACPEKVVNIAGDDVMSKYDAAIALADKYGLDKSLIKPVSVTQTTGIFKAKRAASGTLDNSKLKSLLGIKEIHLEV